MRWIVLVGFLVCAGAAAAEDIVDVLFRSQQSHLDALPHAAPDSDAVRTLQSTFVELVHRTGIDRPVELRVIEGATVAETLLGQVIVVNVEVGQRPRAEQLFILAHELGHVAHGHQAQMGAVFKKWVPGAVVQEQTDAVAPMLGREASALAHHQEFAADAFALRALCAMGSSRAEVVDLFVRMGVHPATATHPASAKRAIALRMTPLDDVAPVATTLAQVR